MAVFKRPGSPNWHVEFEFQGERIRRSAKTKSKRKAEEFERKLRSDLHDHRLLGMPVVQTVSLKEAVERYIKTHVKPKDLKPKTLKSEVYLLDALLERFGPDTPLQHLTAPVIADQKDRLLADGLAPASVNRYLATLKAVLNKAHNDWGFLAVMPKIQLLPQNNERSRWLTEDEEARLLNAATTQPHLKDLLVFLIDTGARLGEATGLEWKNIDLERQPRGLVRFYETKTNKPRSVPLTDRVQTMLKRLHDIKPDGTDLVFLRRTFGSKTRKTKPQAKPFRSPHQAWQTALEKANIKDVRIHDLRHTFASRLVMNGVPIFNVSKLLGHNTIGMTMRYAHLAPDEFDSAIASLDAPTEA